ncbi:DUF6702 family protein [Pedobacter insulae]|uniref:Uncharacterized protein n=1 Tax=Pedobacter insulae TaxID=414048 RepID=A0A1I2TFR5_9SPHI|nr:DUF6702 family protein [Pedobacter insulae]SFG61376.1 hypothetical protein SAMN04489864_101261 [Pedobacter insulae]
MSAIYSKLLLVVLWLATPVHPLHVSTTEINFNSKGKSLEISCRIFTDDFENILAKTFKTKTDLMKPEMHKEMDALVKKYLAANLKYQLNGKPVTANYLGFEIDHEATNVYLEIENVSSLQRLSLTNSIMYDLFDDQMNILHVEKMGIRKSARTEYPSTSLSVTFN